MENSDSIFLLYIKMFELYNEHGIPFFFYFNPVSVTEYYTMFSEKQILPEKDSFMFHSKKGGSETWQNKDKKRATGRSAPGQNRSSILTSSFYMAARFKKYSPLTNFHFTQQIKLMCWYVIVLLLDLLLYFQKLL